MTTLDQVEPLSAADMEILAFERGHWKYAGVKDSMIRERFGINDTRYYARLNHILDQPAAETYDPELVRRLRSMREARRARRNYGPRSVEQ